MSDHDNPGVDPEVQHGKQPANVDPEVQHGKQPAPPADDESEPVGVIPVYSTETPEPASADSESDPANESVTDAHSANGDG